MNNKERLEAITKATLEFFESDNEAAQIWLIHPVYGLDGKWPIDMIGTEKDMNMVLDLLRRLEHGVFS